MEQKLLPIFLLYCDVNPSDLLNEKKRKVVQDLIFVHRKLTGTLKVCVANYRPYKNNNYQFWFHCDYTSIQMHKYWAVHQDRPHSGYWPVKEEVIHEDILLLPSITPNTHAYIHTFWSSTDPTWCETEGIRFSPLMHTQKQEMLNINVRLKIFSVFVIFSSICKMW